MKDVLLNCKMKITPTIKISGRKIGDGYPCYIVAEISCNHHQKKYEAFKLIKAAQKAGADAVKIQTYKPETMTIDSDKKWFRVGLSDDPGSWDGKTLFDLYKKAFTPWEWQKDLAKYAKKIGITLFSTPFDETAVDFLEKEIDPPAYKIASYELLYVPLLRKVAKTGKPVIVSTGFGSLKEIRFAYKVIKDAGVKELAFLHCVTGYSDRPKAQEMNLATISDLKKKFCVVGGFSYNNYDKGLRFPIIGAKYGASIIELHIILNRKLGGFDVRFSSEPNELTGFIRKIREIEKTDNKNLNNIEKRAIGKPHYGPTSKSGKEIRALRRSIFVVENIRKGDIITPQNVAIIRPAFGMTPMEWDKIIGKSFSHDIERGTPLLKDSILNY